MNTSEFRFPLTLLTGLFIFICTIQAQEFHDQIAVRGDIRLMFYNVENLFDTVDNSVTDDNEYLPQSEKNWNGYRYYNKNINLFKTIAAVGGLRPPEIVCFAEIENDTVLKSLIRNTGLSKYSYEIVHYDSPDPRGIDVGLIFRNDAVTLLKSEKISLSLPKSMEKKTRDILYCQFLCKNEDTLHLFVNHWPSRRVGQNKSAPDRKKAASVLKRKINSVLSDSPCANIVIAGDFNDGPKDESICHVLDVKDPDAANNCSDLIALSAETGNKKVSGTYRFRSEWELYDQLIVSGSLMGLGNKRIRCTGIMQIAGFPFLLEEDSSYGGVRPKRTYLGPVYKGGFSDHLPVYTDIYLFRDNDTGAGKKNEIPVGE
jgi:predicted extracellular nuclease